MKNYFLPVCLALATILMGCKNNQSDQEIEPEQDMVDSLTVKAQDTQDQQISSNPNNSSATQSNSVEVDTGLNSFDFNQAIQHMELDGLEVGMEAKDFQEMNIKANQNVEKKERTDRKGEYHEISKGGIPIVEVHMNGDRISQIHLVSKQSTPNDMVGVGTNYASLKLVYPNNQSSIGNSASSDKIMLSDRIHLQMSATAKTGTDSTFPEAAEIERIIIQ
ncbi:hypothetical protein [Nonlabens xiamenensis]|uniref:hypothetical protein n=1 Tax=Nonlabens xiamenensis TaxID=2341043 RepID=UPI000F60A557|nr:hypothetical protein [Nonlabens xiamenensis]